MLTLIDVAAAWVAGWIASGGSEVHISFTVGDVVMPKRSVWLLFEGSDVSGQLTLWETGECELEAYRNSDSTAVLLRSATLTSATGVVSAIEGVVRACAE